MSDRVLRDSFGFPEIWRPFFVPMRFGDWWLGPDARQLFRGNEAVHISPARCPERFEL